MLYAVVAVAVGMVGAVAMLGWIALELSHLRRGWESYIGLLEPSDPRSPLATEGYNLQEKRGQVQRTAFFESDKGRAENYAELAELEAEES